MISGFLMSVVLTESRTYSSLKSFYANRLLRIYPVYAVVAFMTLCAYRFDIQIYSQFESVYKEGPWSAVLLLSFSNAFLFLQDLVMFSSVVDNRLIFSKDFTQSTVLLYKGLLVPQAWTLGVELAFYLIAPFILTRRKVVLLLLVSSIALRLIFIKLGFGSNDPWSYRFFPTELALFLLGSLSHQILLPLIRNKPYLRNRITCICATSMMVLIAVTYHYFAPPTGIYSVALFTTFFILMPFAFAFQNTSAFDKWVGDLSYPIYICHMLVIALLAHATSSYREQNPYSFAWSCVAASACLAFILNKLVAVPVEVIRNKIRFNRTIPNKTS
jgi:peptidoglycan/LPS O-acetylase OafA/YrhL